MINKCLRIAYRFSKKKLPSILELCRDNRSTDLKQNYLQTLEDLGIQLGTQPIKDNHLKGLEAIQHQSMPYQYVLQEQEKDPRSMYDEEDGPDYERYEKVEEETTETQQENKEEELIMKFESTTEQQPQQTESQQIRRRITGKGFKLKKIKDETTFQSPTGQISHLFYNKYVQSKNEIADHNQELLKEYVKGETKIDQRNADPRYRTKIQELMNIYKLEQQTEKLEFDKNVILRDSYQTVAKLKRYRREIELKEENGDVEAFWELVESYPGSRFGPLPEDDPQNFYKFIKGRIPASVKEKYRRQTGQFLIDEEQNQQKNPKDKKQEERKHHSYKKAIKRTPITFRDILAQNRFKQEQVFLQNEKNLSGTSTTFNLEENFLPALPEFEVKDYQSNWQIWLMWQKFRYFYGLIHQDQIFKQMESYLEKCDFSVLEHKPLGSLNNYYQTLPKFLKEHEGVRTVYLGLEYKCPEWSISQKQQALNKAALICLPLEKSCDMMMETHFTMDKYRLSPYEVDRIHNIKPEFTYDDEDFFSEIREEKLRGEKIGEVRALPSIDQFEYGTPKSEAPSLPVDFYDNNDGFWNNYIKDKSNRGAPMMRGRKYFRH